MRALIQRVARARVSVAGDEVAAIGNGLLVFLGVMNGDTHHEAMRLADKTAGLRIFPDACPDSRRMMNRSLTDTGGEALVVSQFTLAADARRGMRPSFANAASPDLAEVLYEHYIKSLEKAGVSVGRGVFGAHMAVSLENDGPVTILLDIEPREGRGGADVQP